MVFHPRERTLFTSDVQYVPPIRRSGGDRCNVLAYHQKTPGVRRILSYHNPFVVTFGRGIDTLDRIVSAVWV